MQWFYITYSLFFFFNKWQFEKNDYQFKETFIKQQDILFNQQINKLRGETDLLLINPSLHSYPSITELQERVPLLSEVLVLGFWGVFCFFLDTCNENLQKIFHLLTWLFFKKVNTSNENKMHTMRKEITYSD